MKKSRILAMFVTLSMLLILAVSAVGPEQIGRVELSLDGGKLEASSLQAIDLQSVLDDYFDARSEAVNQGPSAVPMSADLVQGRNELANDAVLRAAALKNFWADEGIDIVSTGNSASVLSAEQAVLSSQTDLVVYEWTWVYYNNDEGEDSPATDRFGFATVHDMTAALASDGTFRITRDSYDEADISGFTSSDYDEAQFMQAISAVDTTESFASATAEADTAQIAPAATTANTGGMPDVWACIDWANTHVAKDISGSTESNFECYDATFGRFQKNDCANFVSQCFYAGGFVMENPGWFNNQTGGAPDSYSASWAGTQSMQNYWGPKYGGVVSSSRGLYPGNPVFSNNGGHVAIVVGYNTVGKAIINGHTRDVYHQPISDSYNETILINTTSSMVNKPDYATQFPSIPYTYPQTLYINAGKGEWFKFTPTSSGYYSIHSTGNTDTVGYLYTGTDIAGSNPGDPEHNVVQLKEIYYNDDSLVSSDGTNCRVGEFLNAGTTYYFMIRGKTPTTTGYYGLVLLKET